MPLSDIIARILGPRTPNAPPEGLTPQRSPIGAYEWIVDPAYNERYGLPKKNALSYTAAYTQGNSIYLRPDTPADVLRHERIHAAQHGLRNPDTKNLLRILGAANTNQSDDPHVYSYESRALEEPAYTFAAPVDGTPLGPKPSYFSKGYWDAEAKRRAEAPRLQQEALNRYLTLMKMLNPGGIQRLEVAMPDEMLRQYIKTTPPPMPWADVIK